MITATITYVIDPAKVDAFEVYSRAWIHLINRMGGMISILATAQMRADTVAATNVSQNEKGAA